MTRTLQFVFTLHAVAGLFLDFAVQLLRTVGWHLMRVFTLRPAFDKLPDRGVHVLLFLSTYIAVATLRYALVGDYSDEEVAGVIITHALLLAVPIVRGNVTSSLYCLLLASVTVADLSAAAVALLADNAELATGPAFSLLEMILVFSTMKAFNALPEEVRRAGYGRRKNR